MRFMVTFILFPATGFLSGCAEHHRVDPRPDGGPPRPCSAEWQVETVATGDEPETLAIGSDGRRLHIAWRESGDAHWAIRDTLAWTRQEVAGDIPPGASPAGFAAGERGMGLAHLMRSRAPDGSRQVGVVWLREDDRMAADAIAEPVAAASRSLWLRAVATRGGTSVLFRRVPNEVVVARPSEELGWALERRDTAPVGEGFSADAHENGTIAWAYLVEESAGVSDRIVSLHWHSGASSGRVQLGRYNSDFVRVPCPEGAIDVLAHSDGMDVLFTTIRPATDAFYRCAVEHASVDADGAGRVASILREQGAQHLDAARGPDALHLVATTVEGATLYARRRGDEWEVFETPLPSTRRPRLAMLGLAPHVLFVEGDAVRVAEVPCSP
ncbi:MAG: hypothetical protein CMN31_22875 [Sandaracinus sp.]|nr:hypothetical protein [Myxococcales bacterium]MAT27553.1 hypothetical protein [Sandaracinus sp.]MBJ74135.1 hypothetical protein [Sandaracinus sp.]